MTTVTLDYETLILKGITAGGGQPEDENLLTEDDVKNLGRIAAKRGIEQRSLTPTDIPKDGEIFELTHPGVRDADPIGMMCGDVSDPDKFEFKGQEIKGTQTKKFKLVSVGPQPNVEAVNKVLAEHGTPALGQWRQAFMEKYPHPDNKSYIGFTGSEWVGPKGSCLFPYLGGCGVSWDSGFCSIGENFGAFWRFAVEVK